jgi:hypothetical protein
VLALVCEGRDLPSEDKASRSGAVAHGFMAEEMMKWFDRNYLTVILGDKSLFWLKRSLLAALRQAFHELAAYSAKSKQACQTSAALFLLWRKKYIIFQWGETKVYRCRRKIKGLHVDQYSQLKTYLGKARCRDCFLICSNSFNRLLSDFQLCEAMGSAKCQNEKQMAKRLEGIAQYVGQKGEQGSATAIMLRVT